MFRAGKGMLRGDLITLQLPESRWSRVGISIFSQDKRCVTKTSDRTVLRCARVRLDIRKYFFTEKGDQALGGAAQGDGGVTTPDGVQEMSVWHSLMEFS